MAFEPWLPIGFELSETDKAGRVIDQGNSWQIIETKSKNRALLVKEKLKNKWLDIGLLKGSQLKELEFGKNSLSVIISEPDYQLGEIDSLDSPNTFTEAKAIALSFKKTRDIDQDVPLQDALYIEKYSLLLPTYSLTAKTDDDLVFGFWLTGGAYVSVKSFRRLKQAMSWLDEDAVRKVVETAGFTFGQRGHSSSVSKDEKSTENIDSGNDEVISSEGFVEKEFSLAGRPELETFFNEHVVDILKHRDRYKKLGIDFPSAIALHGPPGCGKTFAVEKLVEFLGWPSYEIGASSVASPYIHETSKKVAEVFEKAIDDSPSVLIIDEMEAFLADREMGSGHHRVEEVAEFLRRIPEAVKNDVLIIAMTNRIEIIDPAILRRGRFDHVLKVDFASKEEILSLLRSLIDVLPTEGDIKIEDLAEKLAGRPLSDVTFVVREGARLAARAGNDYLNNESLELALKSSPAREREGREKRRIGFI